MTSTLAPATTPSWTARVGGWLHKPATIGMVCCLATLILYIQAITTGRYNNFIIFRTSFYHLVQGLPLYQPYPAEYFDYFLYHPTFPVLFAPFALLPEKLGLLCWQLSGVAIFLYALRQLPFRENGRLLLAWFLLIELGNAIQSEQTNPAMTAFMILTVVSLQRQQSARAALFACLCFFIKGYGAIAAAAFLFFPRKGPFIIWLLLLGLAGTALPLLFISPALLIQHYTDWFQLLTSPAIKEDGSLLGMLHSMLGLQSGETGRFDKAVLVIAVLMLVYTFACGFIRRVQNYTWLLLAYLLIWIVIFNQSTESPTYIMAVTGVGIGCLAMPLQHRWRNALLWCTLLLASLAPTDLVPKFINQYAVALHIKALPCALVLFFLQACIGGWKGISVFDIAPPVPAGKES